MDKHNLLQRLLLLATLATLSFSCRSSPTGPHVTGNVEVSADYVACTEVWLKIAFSDQQAATSGGTYKITRDSATVLTGSFSGADTTVIDTTTQPNMTYTYQACKLVNGKVSELSIPVQVTTLDTTSNDFTWQIYTFGGTAGSSILKDVAIINDSDIWAVGDIAVKDSSVNGYSVYNLARWDGRKWSLNQVMFPLCDPNGNQQNLQPFECYGVLALSDSDVWLSAGGSLVHWQAGSSQPLCFSLGYGMRALGRMSGAEKHLYIVGTNGFAAYNDGYVWQQLSAVTGLDIDDIWGVSDSAAGQSQVLAVASDQFTDNGVAVLQLSGTQTSMLRTAGLPSTSIVGVWSVSGREWYVCGDGLYKSRDLNRPWEQVKDIPSIYTEAIRGTGSNDIFVVGDFGLVLHFNGSAWTNLTPQVSVPNSVLYAVAVKGNTIVAVGQTLSGLVGGAALVLVGKRN